jgi:hypothetical protein
MPQFSDDLYLGPVVRGGAVSDGPSQMDTGIGPLGRVYMYDVVPLTLQVAGLAASANPGSGGSFTLAAGTGVTTLTVGNETRYVLDVPRSVTIKATGANTATYTITGYDVYGQRMSQTLAAPNTSTVTSTKMFKSVVSVTNANAAAGTNGLEVGYSDLIGLPIKVTSRDYVVGSNFNATAVALSAYTVADATSPATTTTTDVRGYATLPTAADGSKRLVVAIAVPGVACGPNATRTGALGVTQV